MFCDLYLLFEVRFACFGNNLVKRLALRRKFHFFTRSKRKADRKGSGLLKNIRTIRIERKNFEINSMRINLRKVQYCKAILL